MVRGLEDVQRAELLLAPGQADWPLLMHGQHLLSVLAPEIARESVKSREMGFLALPHLPEEDEGHVRRERVDLAGPPQPVHAEVVVPEGLPVFVQPQMRKYFEKGPGVSKVKRRSRFLVLPINDK